MGEEVDRWLDWCEGGRGGGGGGAGVGGEEDGRELGGY